MFGFGDAARSATGAQNAERVCLIFKARIYTMKVLVTGSSGLIGSEAVEHFDGQGHEVWGLDNNSRREFFGPQGDTSWNLKRLQSATRTFRPVDIDIRDREKIGDLFASQRFDLIVHCAAQPSHDKAKDIPLIDFDVNAGGTVNLLEATRKHCPEAIFIFMSTNKVYGDVPNELPLVELETRWEYADARDFDGVDETCRIDRCTHSVFGASKVAADVMTQEYGRYFGLRTGVFRGGCLTGPSHSGVELHGFLNYLVKVGVSGEQYTVFGYKGKQVRDNIHSRDVVRALEAFALNPRAGEVYNLGGGRANSVSMWEAMRMIEELTGRPFNARYDETARVGDHICYISNLSKLRAHYPDWNISVKIEAMMEQMVAQAQKLTAT